MKRLISIGLISFIFIITGCISSGNYKYIPSERTRYYSNDGSFEGHSTTNKYGTRYYNSENRYIGRSK